MRAKNGDTNKFVKMSVQDAGVVMDALLRQVDVVESEVALVNMIYTARISHHIVR